MDGVSKIANRSSAFRLLVNKQVSLSLFLHHIFPLTCSFVTLFTTKGRTPSFSSTGGSRNTKEKISPSKRPMPNMLHLLRPILAAGSSNNQPSSRKSKRIPEGQLCRVGGCKASSNCIVKQLMDAGANRLGSQPRAPLDVEFGVSSVYVMGFDLGERSLSSCSQW